MDNSVNKEQISKEILNSNLSDETKIELFRIIFKETAQVMPYTIAYPYEIRNPNNDWEITCKNLGFKLT